MVVAGVEFDDGQNMHEIACISGIAAAYRLGATYEAFDDFAEECFSKYLLVSHGVRYKRASGGNAGTS